MNAQYQQHSNRYQHHLWVHSTAFWVHFDEGIQLNISVLTINLPSITGLSLKGLCWYIPNHVRALPPVELPQRQISVLSLCDHETPQNCPSQFRTGPRQKCSISKGSKPFSSGEMDMGDCFEQWEESESDDEDIV
jgi:hypothetical protein